jgi:16S rRNA (adenine1518-N6/adenine1519-N6)-dimethyltransferase
MTIPRHEREEGRDGPRAALERRGLRPKYSFGQNFLHDQNIAARIAELATTPEGGTVVEIGAGLGALTRPLLARAARVVAIERDRDLVPALAEDLATDVDAGRLLILEADAKTADVPALFGEGPAPRVLTGNLPYQLSGFLVERAVEFAPLLDRAVFMLQLEVVARLAAEPSGPDYGALTVFVQAAFAVKKALVVKRGAFFPQPNVDSAVVVLTPLAPRITEETPAFRAVVKAAFSQRRKTLRNAWRTLPLDRDGLARAATRAGIDLDARGETLDVTAFARMAENVADAFE